MIEEDPSPAIQGPPLLELEAISVIYPGRDHSVPIELLNGVSVSVSCGEMTVVAGRSGSGKTTLLNVAAGLIRPSSGTVRWSGDWIGELSRDELAKRRGRFIGMVFQSAALIESLTAAENVALAGVPSGVSRDRDHSIALLEQFGLRARARHFPAQLSGGEQQRVAIARALYADAPLLIVDEPTANLDRRTADELIDGLHDLRREKRGLLVASHDPHVINMADRLIELEAVSP